MGTTDTFDSPASGALAATDEFPIKSAATSRAATATLAQLSTYVSGPGATTYTAAGSTLTLTAAANAGHTIKLDTLTGSVVTLPPATGSGTRIKFVVTVLATSNSHIIKVTTNDTMIGLIVTMDDTANNAEAFKASGTDDTITLNRTTTGSVSLGEWIEVEDIAADLWHVRGVISNSGTAATPFSATV